ncbi:DUF3413 domain-containing protein [Thorsellia anophelis]|uniref:Inner membrane protein YejM N-terminal domain-containing protein n=1 Tax=Thorsellia anophelis DSM 18579 TaxID=1123402 RepID=A0A1I0AG96_9GAMM|nr:DUF3413 domain-containing protein [Thorsellia anophelis]SES93202.1 hypothetical protein SAMN02583745_00943 [Thorsellia anophelis DSM 18579]
MKKTHIESMEKLSIKEARSQGEPVEVSLFDTKRTHSEKILKAEARYQVISWGHWFTLFNILLCFLLASRYLLIMDWPNTLGGRLYAFVSLLGHFSFLVFIVYLVLLFPLSFVLRNAKTLRIIAVSIATIGLTLMLVDQQVFSSVNLHINPLVWSLMIEPSYNVSTHEWQRFFAFMPIIFLVQLLFANWSWLKLRSLQRQSWVKWLSVIFVMSFMATHLIFAWADASFYRPITMQKVNYPFAYPMTARTFLEQYGLLDHDSYEARLAKEGDPTVRSVTYPLTKLTLAEHSSNYNIALIVLDELTPEMIELNPNLNRFSKTAISFNEHMSDTQPLFSLEYGISPIFKQAIIQQNIPSIFYDALKQRQYSISRYLLSDTNHPNELLPGVEYFIQPNAETLTQTVLSQLNIWQDTPNQIAKPWFISIKLEQAHKISRQRALDVIIPALQNANGHTLIIVTSMQSGHNDNSVMPNKVPLFIQWPELALDAPVDKITTNQDILRTLAQRVLKVTNLPSDYSQGEDIFYPHRINSWWVDGIEKKIIIHTSESSITLSPKRADIIDRRSPESLVELSIGSEEVILNAVDNEQSQFKRQQLGIIIQALFDIQRFWQN